jgi:hypothetical protein
VSNQPAVNPQAKQALKSVLIGKAAPSWAAIAATPAVPKLVQVAKTLPVPPPAEPEEEQEKVRLSNAARNHYQDVKRANDNDSTSEVGTLPHNDAGLVDLVEAHWDDFERDGQDWTLELGSFLTRHKDWGEAQRRWMVIGKYVDDGATFLVTHYGPTGSG